MKTKLLAALSAAFISIMFSATASFANEEVDPNEPVAVTSVDEGTVTDEPVVDAPAVDGEAVPFVATEEEPVAVEDGTEGEVTPEMLRSNAVEDVAVTSAPIVDDSSSVVPAVIGFGAILAFIAWRARAISA
jgi:hypothetical protein